MNFTEFKKQMDQKGYQFDNYGVRPKKGSGVSYRFSYTAEEMPNCCGAKELGYFNVRTESNRALEGKNLPKKGTWQYFLVLGTIAFSLLKEKGAQRASVDSYEDDLETSTAHMKQKFPKYKLAYSVIFYTNGNFTCNLIEEAIKTFIPQHYKKVHSVINPNSGNLITLWAAKY